jgi:hypothetical protein
LQGARTVQPSLYAEHAVLVAPGTGQAHQLRETFHVALKQRLQFGRRTTDHLTAIALDRSAYLGSVQGASDFLLQTHSPGSPAADLQRIRNDVAAVLQQPDIRQRMLEIGGEPVGNTPEEFEARVRKEIAMGRQVAAVANIKPQ